MWESRSPYFKWNEFRGVVGLVTVLGLSFWGPMPWNMYGSSTLKLFLVFVQVFLKPLYLFDLARLFYGRSSQTEGLGIPWRRIVSVFG